MNTTHPTIPFQTHPNAPVVVNWFVTRGNRRFYNRNPWFAKYAPAATAEWTRDTMNRINRIGRTYYIVP